MKRVNPRNWIPKGNYKEYYLYWFSDIPENCDRGFVGAVRNTADEETKILIEIDDLWMQNNNQRGCCINVGDDYYKDSIIVITKDFFDECMKDNDECLLSLWHEVGHYHTLHHFPEYALNVSKMRRGYIERGQIAPAEYVADLFGLYYLEDEIVQSAMLKMTRNRHKLVDQGDENALLAWHELRQRRRALKELNNDEMMIISEMMKACNVEQEQDI